jgi:hypothetical protein
MPDELFWRAFTRQATDPMPDDAFWRVSTRVASAWPLAPQLWTRRKSIRRQYRSAMAQGGATRLPCGHVDRRVSTGDLHPRRPVPSGGPSGLLLRCGEPRSSRRGSPFSLCRCPPARRRPHPPSGSNRVKERAKRQTTQIVMGAVRGGTNVTAPALLSALDTIDTGRSVVQGTAPATTVWDHRAMY